MKKVDLSNYKNKLSIYNKIFRFIWSITWAIFARPFPRKTFNFWKIFLLRLFGAKIHSTADIYSSANIYAPWNLVMKEYSCIGSEVDCYNIDQIIIGANSTISQKSYLCTASHDVSKSNYPLITAPIIIKDQVWIGADVFLGMGVTINQGAVVGARSSVFKDVNAWSIVGGSPAKFLKKREINE